MPQPEPQVVSAPDWRALKFGGSSVTTVAHWAQIAAQARQATNTGASVLIVVSALRGVTDRLEAHCHPATAEKPDELYRAIRQPHEALAAALGVSMAPAEAVLEELQATARALAAGDEEPATQAQLLATGELLSSLIGAQVLAGAGLDCRWLDSREVLVSRNDERRGARSRYLSAECDSAPDPALAQRLAAGAAVWVAPGYVASNAAGQTVVLGRGGSDTSAALFAARLDARQLEIFSDVPGLFSADPRKLPGARLLKLIGYREALELAAMGARALHPRALLPLRQHQIPLQMRQTDRPQIEGTRIGPEAREHGAQVKAIVQRRDITLITLEGLGMWQQVGFLADVFQVFREHGLSIDLVSTSESNVTLTLDPGATLADEAALHRLSEDLGRLCRVEILTGCASVSLVGLGIRTILHRLGPALEVFEQRRIFMVSQAANDLNLTFVVEARHADRLVQQLHQQIIPGGVGGDSVFGPSWDQLNREAGQPTAAPTWWRQQRTRLLELMEGREAAYAYFLPAVTEAAARLRAITAVDRVLYSMKANPHPAILKTVRAAGLGLECVSLAETRRALEQVGADQTELLFTPNFASRDEYRAALSLNVPLTLDNPWILEEWGSDFAGHSVFLRLDPGSGLGHHKLVRTAGSHAKFGIPLAELERTRALCARHRVRVIGLHAHTGSGIMHPDNWHRSLEVLLTAAHTLPEVRVINLGGGLGVPDREDELPLDLAALAAGIERIKDGLGQSIEVWLEPGRFLVAGAGVLLARVTQTKGKGDVRYLGVATGMNSLIRPALYGAWHEIVNLSRLDEAGDQVYNVVGPICETGDILGLDRLLPEAQSGDVMLIANTGAYGAVMSSNYNLRPPAAEFILE